MGKIRTIRLSTDEEKQVLEFLRRNPFIDFSTMTRIALKRFMENPKLTVNAVKKESGRQSRRIANESL